MTDPDQDTRLATSELARFIAPLCAFLGFALQIQYSFGVTATYNGLRINLADLALPFAGLITAASLLLRRSRWPEWQNRMGWLWPLLLSGIMVMGLLNGYYHMHKLTHWALVNKSVGWAVIVAYFLLGGWAGTNGGNPAIRLFLKTFTATFVTIMIGNIAMIGGGDILGALGHPQPYTQLKGFMDNRNAFGFLSLMLFSGMAALEMSGRPTLPRILRLMFWLLFPLALAYDGSRATALAATILVVSIAIMFRARTIRPLLLPLLAGTILVGSLYAIKPGLVIREHQDEMLAYLLEAARQGMTYNQNPTQNGDLQRLRVLHESLDLWKQSPVTGIGVGAFLEFEAGKYPHRIESLFIIDATPLWILVELGLIGFMAFAAFGLSCLPVLWQGRALASDSDIARLTLLGTFLAFGIMTPFHELLYSRHLWFALGLALARPKDNPA